MRTNCTLTLSFMMALAGCAGPKQTIGINDLAAPQHAKVLVVETDLTPQEAYRRTAQVLQDHGYALAHTDTELLSITTEPRNVGRAKGIKITAGVREGPPTVVVFRGTHQAPFVSLYSGSGGREETDIEKWGQTGSPLREAWLELHKIADAVGQNISYEL